MAQQLCFRLGCNSGNSGAPKACAACGTVSYCSKECQRLDWKRHKQFCVLCRPFKDFASQLTMEQKVCLDRLSRRTLPPIREEYRNVFPCDVNHHIYIECGVVSISNQVVENLSILAGDDTATENLLKRWQEVSPNLYDFLRDAQPGDISSRNSTGHTTLGRHSNSATHRMNICFHL